MDDIGLMGRFQGLGDLLKDFQRLGQRQRTVADPFGQGLALGQLHHQKALAAILLEAMDGGDVGMIQFRQDLGFALKAGQPFRIVGKLIGQDLDRHLTIELRVGSTVHLSHATLA